MMIKSKTIRVRISTRECLLKLSSSWIPTIMIKWVTRNTSIKKKISNKIQMARIAKKHTYRNR